MSTPHGDAPDHVAEVSVPDVDIVTTLRPLRHVAGDPSHRRTDEGVFKAFHTPAGPVTVGLSGRPERVRVAAWGPGSEVACAAVPDWFGSPDPQRFDHPLVEDLRRRHIGLRIGRFGRVVEHLVPAILGQKVTGREAERSYRQLAARLGRRAPGPHELRLPPHPDDLAAVSSADFHRFGVERKRADTIRRVARHAHRLEEALSLPPTEGLARLLAVPGVGPWTVGLLAAIAWGDRDAVIVGDYHLPHLVSWNLAGEPRGDDERMLALLEPFRGHRYVVLRLLEIGGRRPPRYGPRLATRDRWAW